MCGIVGILARNSQVDGEALKAAVSRLHHRGPELQRQWISPNGRVGLGHARLSIIDLDTGQQPIANENERCHIVVNGELYDFERIRESLIQKGHKFRTLSDSEIALHLYEEYGVSCLEHLRGEFALTLWDEDNGQIFAARDRFGIKPLYYTIWQDSLYVASEIKALFAAGVPARWDYESCYQQLFLFVDQDRTLFEGIYQVPPGHYLLAGANHLRILPYWDMNYPRTDELKAMSDEACIEGFTTAFDEAVRLRLRSDVPVSCFLSGGIDSSATLGFAARHTQKPIHAFTVTFEEKAYDESAIARETAKMVGVEYTEIPLGLKDFADHLGDAVAHAETVGVNMHGVARFLQSKAIHKLGYKVALTGEGADEILAGYGHSRQDLMRNPNVSEQIPSGLPAMLKPVARTLGYVPSWMQKLAVDRAIFHALLPKAFSESYKNRNPYRLFLDQFDVVGQLKGRSPMIQSLYLWARSILPNYILLTDRLEMAHSLETRLAFLDHHLFETVRTMPSSVLVRDMKEKFLLREAAKPVITDTIYQRAKHPFTAPHAMLSPHNPLYHLVQDTLRSADMKDIPFFDQSVAIALLDSLPKMSVRKRMSFDPPMMMMLCACLLKKSYGVSNG